MATTIEAATLTVTLTEAISLNGYDQGSKNILSISSVTEAHKRIITVPTSERTIINIGTLVGAGMFVEGDVKYIRITNLDDTNFVTVGLSDDSSDTAYLKLEKGQSIIIGGTDEGPQVDIHASAGAFAAWASVDSLILDADTASCDVEIFAAMT